MQVSDQTMAVMAAQIYSSGHGPEESDILMTPEGHDFKRVE